MVTKNFGPFSLLLPFWTLVSGWLLGTNWDCQLIKDKTESDHSAIKLLCYTLWWRLLSMSKLVFPAVYSCLDELLRVVAATTRIFVVIDRFCKYFSLLYTTFIPIAFLLTLSQRNWQNYSFYRITTVNCYGQVYI